MKIRNVFPWNYAIIPLSLAFWLLILAPGAQAQEGGGDPVTGVEVTVGSSGGGPNQAQAVTVTSGSMYRDDVDTLPVTINCTDKNGKAVANASVSISMSDTSVATVSPTSGTTDSNGNVSATITSADVNSANTTNTVTATCQSASGSATINLTGVSLMLLSVVGTSTVAAASGVPNQGDQNWATIQAAGNFATFKVTTQPDLPSVWNAITWGSGQAVPNQGSDYREFPTDTSVKDTISPTITGSGLPNGNYLWIIWGAITLNWQSTLPAGEPNVGPYSDGTTKLGCVVDNLGLEGWGKYVAVCKLTPGGVHTVVKSGFTMLRMRNNVCKVDGTAVSATKYPKDNTQGQFVSDTSSAFALSLVPDASDQIYDADSPSVSDDDAAVNEFQVYADFKEYAQWNNITCSNTSEFYYNGTWQNETDPSVSEITSQTLGMGNPGLP